jgi:hypothetical protein
MKAGMTKVISARARLALTTKQAKRNGLVVPRWH